MKIQLTLLFVMVLCVERIDAQEEIFVLKKQLQGNYTGLLKNGLAHGKGIAIGLDIYRGKFRKGLPDGVGKYIYQGGEVYLGEMRWGMRHGEGAYTFMQDELDTTLIGIWHKDEFMGRKFMLPKVIHEEGIVRYRFDRNGEGDQIFIEFLMKGMPNTLLEDFMIIGTNGFHVERGRLIGYENISYPFTCKINYISWNQFHTAQHYVLFEFEILEPGDWKLTIHN